MIGKDETFSLYFGRKVTENEKLLRKIYSTDFHPPEIEFLSEALKTLSHDLGTLDDLLHVLLKVDFEEKGKNALRQNTLTTKILDNFIEENTKRYLKMVLKEPLTLVLENENLDDLEIDKNKVLRRIYEQEGGKDQTSRVEDLNPISKKYNQVYRKVKENSARLSKCIELFCNFLFNDDSIKLLPFQLKCIFRYVYDLSEKIGVDPIPRVGSILVLRMINPSILFPIKKKIIQNEKLDLTKKRRLLMLITKGIQLVANRGDIKDNVMKNIKESLEEFSQKYEEFVKKICISKEEIKKYKEEYQRIKSIQNEDEFNDISLFLMNFFKSKKLDVDSIIDTSKYGQVIYLGIYKIKNPKKKKKTTKEFHYCIEDYAKRDVTLMQKDITSIIKQIMREEGEFLEREYTALSICRKFDCRLRVYYSFRNQLYVACLIKNEMSKFLMEQFLREVGNEFIISKNKKIIVQALDDSIVDINCGKRFSPKDLLPNLRTYMMKQNEEPSIPEDNEESEVDVEHARTLFKHIPSSKELKRRFKRNTSRKKNFMFSKFDSKSVREDW